ncbi:MAG: glycosyltransferase family 2 protein [Acidobacteria bacterium]|nr:glycosyltransferase family 2 protein [Acidobacteriota bacterium]
MSAAELLFLGCIGIIVYTYFGYPLVLIVWTGLKRADPEASAPPGTDMGRPSVSMIIPAYNEEAVIARKIRNSLELDYPSDRLEIVVVSDGSSDATERVAREAAGGRIRLVFREDHQGKTACLNAVLPDLTGQIVVFTDANAFFLRDALTRLVAHFSDPRVGCVMGELNYRNEGSLNAALGEGLYWRYENFIKERESRLGSTIVGNGAIYALRRSLCLPLPLEVEADVANPLLALRAGYRVIFDRGARCWERAAGTVQEEFGRKTRIITNQLATYLYGFRQLAPLPAAALFQIFCHKFLRWLVPFFLAGVALASAAESNVSALWGWILGLQGAFYSLAVVGWAVEVGGRTVPKPLFVPYYFCAVNAAAVKGILDFVLGRRRIVWEKAASTR